MNFFYKTFLERITLNKVLLAVAVFMLAIIMGTTVAVKSRKNAAPLVKAEPQQMRLKDSVSYKALGRLRAATLPEKDKKSGTTVVFSPLVSYKKDDKEFLEELSRKNSMIKSIFVKYFSGKTLSQLKSKTDQQIKNELLAELNEILVLNKIQDIYFEELIFLD